MSKATSYQKHQKYILGLAFPDISVHNTAKPRGPKGTYAPSSTARIKNGRQQIDSKRRGGTSQ
jgi:hypothetical protein